MLRKFMNLFYAPTEEAKAEYDGMKKESTDIHFVNSGSLVSSTDSWVGENVEFEGQYNGNIAELNPWLNELTTWKHIYDNYCFSDSDTIEFCHYRKWLADREWNEGEIHAATPIPMVFKTPGGEVSSTDIEGGFRICHVPYVWDLMEEKVSSWSEMFVWEKWKRLEMLTTPMNLFRMSVPDFRAMFEFVFPRVMAVHSRLDYGRTEFSTLYQRRQCAFVAERLFSFWCFIQQSSGTRRIVPLPTTIRPDFKPISDAQERETRI